MFDQLGGIERLVQNKTVTIKVNMTGPPEHVACDGLAPALTHYTHPKVGGRRGLPDGPRGRQAHPLRGKRVGHGGPLEDVMLASGWDVRGLQSAAANVEFENTNALGKGKRYARFTVPGSAYMYPGYDLNHAYEDTDVYVSMAKLKNHATCGVTLSLKNCFGTTSGIDLRRRFGRGRTEREAHDRAHATWAMRASGSPRNRRRRSCISAQNHDPGYRVPHIVADLAAARPIHLAIIDGVETDRRRRRAVDRRTCAW